MDPTEQLAQWRRRVDKELGATPFESLRTKLPEGFLMEPLYNDAGPSAGHVAAAPTELAPAPATPAPGNDQLDLRPWDGAHMVDQLGIALAMVVDALRKDLTALSVVMPIGPDLLREVAKLRALRRLVARVAEEVGTDVALTIHATTSHRQAAPDLGTNLVRNAVAVFAALVGGADRVSPLAHSDDPEHARLADNVARLGLHEAHLARVADPAAGSYALESLTGELCARAWCVFQELEAHGGYADPRARVIAEARFTSRGLA